MKSHLLLPILSLSLLSTARIQAQPASPGDPETPRVVLQDNARTEGIHVSGKWTIAVRNPNGTLADFVSFENALEPGADSLLAALIGGALQTGYWVIDLQGPAGPCLDGSSNPISCRLQEIPTTQAGWEHDAGFDVLTVNVGSDLVLGGTFTPNNDATADITTVGTRAIFCDIVREENCIEASTGSFSEDASDLQNFTSTLLGTAISVDPGQAVTVEVTVSFN